MEGKIELSNKQLKRHTIVTQLIDGFITRQQAAEVLGLSIRQIDRIKKGFKELGPASLVHKNSGRIPSHAIKKEVIEKVVSLKGLPAYRDANFNHFQELLARYEGIHISYGSLYSILKSAGFSSPLKQIRRKKHSRRRRKPNFGQLLQIDATPFEWFGSNPKFALHAAIDDATGIVTGAYFTDHECLHGYFETLRQTCLNYGIAQTVYSDKHSIFRSPKSDKLSLAEELDGKQVNLTQFGRSLDDLGINLIHAHSPQAKGRIERLWATLQSRLPVELALRNITTIEAANGFLPEYLELFNQTFSINHDAPNLFVPYSANYDIDSYLCIKHNRKTDNAGTFSINRACFKVLDEGFPLIPSKSTIQVLISPRRAIRVKYQDRIYDTIRYVKPDSKSSKKPPKVRSKSKKLEPYLVHGSDLWKNIWHAEDYDLSLEFIYNLFFKKQA